jgi:hypothetical protein
VRSNGSCCQIVVPLPGSKALMKPCVSWVTSMPSIMIGVDRR